MMLSHSVIIPACGDGKRFGTDAPKHLVNIAGRPMVQRVIDALPDNIDIYLLVRAEYAEATRNAVQAPNLSVVPVSLMTHSVCETLMYAPVRKEARVLIVNCDNVISPFGGWLNILSRYKNAVVTFVEQDTSVEPPPFSYVRTVYSFIVEIAEKRRICEGALACAGAFLFEDYDTLRLLCKWHLSLDPPDFKKEHYLAPVYTRLIQRTNVHSLQLHAGDTFIRMGTPLEAEDARKHYVLGNQRQSP